MRLKRQTHVIHEPIYRFHVSLCVGHTFKQWQRDVHDRNPCGDDPCTCVGDEPYASKHPERGDIFMRTAIIGDSTTMLIWIPKWGGRTSGYVAMLSHELLHVALHILRAVGFTLTEDGEEALTYLHQWLLQKALERLRK